MKTIPPCTTFFLDFLQPLFNRRCILFSDKVHVLMQPAALEITDQFLHLKMEGTEISAKRGHEQAI